MSALFRYIRQRIAAHTDEAEARALAFLLLEESFGVSAMEVYTDKVKHFSADEAERLESYLQRLEKGEPIQYILSRASFLGRSFEVSPAVLIPRPETEELVRWVAEEGAAHRGRIIDAGTGSGCIAVSLALDLPEASVQAWDVSSAALRVAQRNAARLGAQVDFVQRDMLSAAGTLGADDWVVSNPPYVRQLEAEAMEERVLAHEPHLALFVPDDDALRFYRALALLGAATIYCEINEYLPAETAQLFAAHGYRTALRCDGFGKSRLLKAWR